MQMAQYTTSEQRKNKNPANEEHNTQQPWVKLIKKKEVIEENQIQSYEKSFKKPVPVVLEFTKDKLGQ